MKFFLNFVFIVYFFSTSVSAQDETTSLNVVASFSILGDVVQVIAGDRVMLTVLVGPDSDGHLYQPSAADARALVKADLLIANGLGFETWLDSLIQASGFHGKPLLVGEAIKPIMVQDHHDPAIKIPDPHAWQDIGNVIAYVRRIAAELSALDEINKSFYNANAERYLAELDALDQQIKTFTQSLPPQKRKLVTSHDAFGYFGAAYGLNFIAPQGISTDAEAKTQDIAQLIQQIRREKIPALFVENMLDDRLLQQISRETQVHIGGELYSDALSKLDGKAPNYLTLMKHNLSVLQQALK